MIVLGIESATPQVGCAIGGHEGVLASMHSARGRRHAENLVPGIEFVCKQAGLTLDEISVIAVDIGPGLFTGMRVGIASAKALAFALRVPMIGMTSLDLLAHPLRHSRRTIRPVIDARRGEVFTAAYRAAPGGLQQILEPTITTAAELAAELAATSDDTLLVGDGAVRYADEFAGVEHVMQAGTEAQYPSANSLVQLAHARALREEFVRGDEIAPAYLRAPDAEVNFTQRSDGGVTSP